ncbi:MAG: methionyl-tRNA formyltransferase [Proteobacteria bacterium]|nr:methionyl-tRNA formyltransferase [Pseudomonadota bacterium]
MILDNVLFLAARTARSQAYAQAMLNAGMSPASAIVYGAAASRRLGQPDDQLQRLPVQDLFIPDPCEPLDATLEKLGTPVALLEEDSVNSSAIIRQLNAMAPSLVIYSGYGSEIVPASLCGAYQFLHIHAGWLPDYRGSTTIYYSLLREKRCGVSALLLVPTIDAGPILLRRHYPPPPRGLNIDYIYDSALRADLLIDVLKNFARGGLEAEMLAQAEGEGRTYFVVHPVLKNIVIERLEAS